MADQARPQRALLAASLLVAFVLVAAAAPATARALAPPVETCSAQETRAAGDFNICSPETTGGDAGPNLGALLPIVGIVALGGVIALVAAFFVLRRTAAPLMPADPGEWWTCRSCGKTNVLGSARCYACGTWQR